MKKDMATKQDIARIEQNMEKLEQNMVRIIISFLLYNPPKYCK
ncbi:hypothetical protein [Caloranaerobacter azorensis]|nr:hypothetical protein [Caloranaerobacter azorensis]